MKNETVNFSVLKCVRMVERGSFCQNVLSDIKCTSRPVRKYVDFAMSSIFFVLFQYKQIVDQAQ